MAKNKTQDATQDTLSITSIMDAHNATRDVCVKHIFNGRNSVALVDVVDAICVGFVKGERDKIKKKARQTLRKKYATYATNESHRHEFVTPDNAEVIDRYLDCALIATRVYTRDSEKLKNAMI